jgi:hypothetical protein
MKNVILLLLLFLYPALLFAQGRVMPGKMDNGKYRMVFVYNVYNRNAEHIFHVANTYVNDHKNEFFFSNGKRKLAWYAENSALVAIDKNEFGIAQVNKADRSIKVPIVYRFEGDGMGSIGYLLLHGFAYFDVKDGKCKLELSDFTYEHFSGTTGKKAPIIAEISDGSLPTSGRLEDLYTTRLFRMEMGDLFDDFFDHYRSLVKDFHADLREYVNDSVQDF